MAACSTATQPDLDSMLTSSSLNPIAAAAVAEFRLRQQAIQAEQNHFLAANKEKSELSLDISGDTLAKQVRSKLTSDLAAIGIFNASTANSPLLAQIPWAVRTHKMVDVIIGAQAMLGTDDETNIMRIATGQLPINYSNVIDESMPILGSGNFWGTSQVTFLSCAIMTVNLTMYGRTIRDLPLDPDLTNSAIMHVAPLPADVVFDPACRLSYHTSTTRGFCYFHSGYSFGGYRNEETFYPHGKQFGPEDCSSWVAKRTGCPRLFSTVDLLYTYRSLTNHGLIPKDWLSSPEATCMRSLYSSVENASSGDIYASRTFRISDPIDTSSGIGGHTAMVLSQRGSTVTTLGFNRDMPKIEGFGIQEFPLNPPPSDTKVKRVMFLRSRPA